MATLTVDNGFLPAFTEEQLEEVSVKAASKHVKTLQTFCSDFNTVEEYRDDLAAAFTLGAMEASKKATEGRAVRSFQWKYGEGYMLRRLHEIIGDICQSGKNVQVDSSGGAYTGEESEEENPGVVLAGRDIPVNMNTLAAVEDMDAATNAMNSLPADLRTIVQFRAVEEMTFKEIGDILNTDTVTVFNRYNKAIKLLRKKLTA